MEQALALGKVASEELKRERQRPGRAQPGDFAPSETTEDISSNKKDQKKKKDWRRKGEKKKSSASEIA
jgi:hypothetical protein